MVCTGTRERMIASIHNYHIVSSVDITASQSSGWGIYLLFHCYLLHRYLVYSDHPHCHNSRTYSLPQSLLLIHSTNSDQPFSFSEEAHCSYYQWIHSRNLIFFSNFFIFLLIWTGSSVEKLESFGCYWETIIFLCLSVGLFLRVVVCLWRCLPITLNFILLRTRSKIVPQPQTFHRWILLLMNFFQKI